MIKHVNASNDQFVIRPNKRVFFGINLVLFPLVLAILIIGLGYGFIRGEFVPTWRGGFAVFGSVVAGILFLNVLFSSYKIIFDDNILIYRHFLRRRTIQFSDVQFARNEFGYDSYLSRWRPIKRFVIYLKPEIDKQPLIINLSPMSSINNLISKFERLGKLGADKDFSES